MDEPETLRDDEVDTETPAASQWGSPEAADDADTTDVDADDADVDADDADPDADTQDAG